MNTNFVRGDSFLFKFSIKNKQEDNITAEDKVIEIESREPSIEQIIGNEVE